jgi:putative YphP/YqiW family bacilliredoxin
MHYKVSQQPTYDPDAVQPMRDELAAVGFEELFSSEDIDRVLDNNDGKTVLIMINSVCGCSAGSARPGVTSALQHHVIPDHLVTVFAGQDKEAVAHLRQRYFPEYPASSPSIALMKNGRVIFFLQRHDIEGKKPDEIADKLKMVFDQECAKEGPSISPEAYAELRRAVACGSKIPRFVEKF